MGKIKEEKKKVERWDNITCSFNQSLPKPIFASFTVLLAVDTTIIHFNFLVQLYLFSIFALHIYLIELKILKLDFWDGRGFSVEHQCFIRMMHYHWPCVVQH